MSRPIGDKGLSLIKEFEGCRTVAYKPVRTEKYFTIGYGHYGPDVRWGMIISKAKAEELLKTDCQRFADAVDALGRPFTDNQRDALISFAYNCGAGNLRTLCKDRSFQEISVNLMNYTRSGTHVLPGLVRRRKAEQILFNTPVSVPTSQVNSYDYSLVFDAEYYAKRYADLAIAKIIAPDQLFQHFKDHGMSERRQANNSFNVNVYIDSNPDLKVFGDNYPEYYKHYMRIGHTEARKHC